MKLQEFLNDKSIEQYFNEKIAECIDYEELPRELVNCSCCERHKINFPILGNKIYPDTKNKNKSTYKFKCKCKCKCPCRHIARHICREWEKLYEIEDISTEESEISEEEDSYGSLEDFIVNDKGLTNNERKKLNKILCKK